MATLYWIALILVVLIFTPFLKALAYCLLVSILFFIRWWPITVVLFIAVWGINDYRLEGRATLEHPYVRRAIGRFHYPGQTWIDARGLRHTVDFEGMETVVPANARPLAPLPKPSAPASDDARNERFDAFA